MLVALQDPKHQAVPTSAGSDGDGVGLHGVVGEVDLDALGGLAGPGEGVVGDGGACAAFGEAGLAGEFDPGCDGAGEVDGGAVDADGAAGAAAADQDRRLGSRLWGDGVGR